VPVSVPIEPAPLGAPAPDPAGDWRELEAERVARLGEQLGEPVAAGDVNTRRKPLFS
jgi:hypothetical protein